MLTRIDTPACRLIGALAWALAWPKEALAGGGAAASAEGMPAFLLGLGILLLAAKVAGEVCAKGLGQPSVLGELAAGVALGPFALGPWIGFAPVQDSTLPIPASLDLISHLGVLILLFLAGVETEVAKFLRAGLVAAVVALGGVLVPFAVGMWATWQLYDVPAGYDRLTVALFVGAALTATSVGITARVLKDLRQLRSRAGTVILGAAVIDDILGIIVLAIVVRLSAGAAASPTPGGDGIGLAIVALLLKAVCFWVALLYMGLQGARWINRALRWFGTPDDVVTVAIAFGLAVSWLAEAMGLAMVIGAYAAGLVLACSDKKSFLEDRIAPIYNFLAPVFFVCMGMLVDLGKIGAVLGFGLLVIGLAILTKLLGAGLAAWAMRMPRQEALQVGVGMIPRGEVGFIVAYLGLVHRAIDSRLYLITIMMSFATTMITPPLLRAVFGPPAPRDEADTAG